MTDGIASPRSTHRLGSSRDDGKPTSVEPGPGARWALVALGAYLLASIGVGAYVRRVTWDAREFEWNPVDYTWQLELPWRAMKGEISGVDFHFPMGPLWQGLAWLGALPGPLDAGRAIAGMQALTQLLGVIAALVIASIAIRSRLLSVWVASTLALLAYGAGAATVRPVLSLAHVLAYLPSARDDREPTWRDAFVAASLATLGLLLSFDRLVLACVAAVVMAGVELAVRAHRRRQPRLAWLRLGRYVAAQAACLTALALVSWALGASPLAYLREQRQIAAAYSVNLARTAEVDSTTIAAFLLVACVIALVAGASRERRSLELVWIAGALPLAAFALPQPNPGHVFLGVMPLAGVLVVMAARRDVEGVALRAAAGLCAMVFVLGWFGTHRENVWLAPDVFLRAARVAEGKLAAQQGFETDLTRAVDWVRRQREQAPPRCVAFSPGLAAAHPLADMPGPTSLGLRWNSRQQRALGDSIARAACPWFVYQLGSFDRPDRPNWFLGEDLFAINRLYEPALRIGPATVVLALRREQVAPEIEPLSSELLGRTLSISVPGEVVVPLGRSLEGADFLWLDHTLHAARLSRVLGAAPEIHYRFEQSGVAVDEEAPWSDLEVGTRAQSTLALDPTFAEWRWLASRDVGQPRRADSLRLRFAPRGVLSPKSVSFTVHGLARWRPASAVVSAPRESCQPDLDLLDEIASGRAMARGVALRPTAERFLLHPTPKPEKPAEVFFPLRPCAGACLLLELGIEMPTESGDGALVDVHVIDGRARPRLRRDEVLPGQPPLKLEVPLEPWVDREILLRLGSETRDDPSSDFLFVGLPRMARCSNRALIAERLRQGQAQLVRGESEAPGRDVRLRGDAELHYPLYVSADTCLAFDASVLDGPEATVDLALHVSVDGRRHRLDRRRMSGSAAPERLVYSLHDWLRRHVVLSVVSTPVDAPAGVRLELGNLRMDACNAI